VRCYSLRPNSGGEGKYRGGDGIVREIEVLTEADVTLLADRRQGRPYGLKGGEPGAAGRTDVLRADGSRQQLAGKASVRLKAGERIRVETPGGGGWGLSRRK
jgi:N-methylhydantoinase B